MDNSKNTKKSITDLLNHSVDGSEIKGGQVYNDDGTMMNDDPGKINGPSTHDKIQGDGTNPADSWDGTINTVDPSILVD